MKKLKKIYIEITNICNLSCVFCPGTSRKPEFMDEGRFGAILAKLQYTTDYLYFHVLGEPLLHPELGSFLQLSARYGFKVNITTNGLLIREREEVLLQSSALRQVNFSLHSQEESSDEELLEAYLEDIFTFTEKALEKVGIYISFRLWNLTSRASVRYNAFVAEKIGKRFHAGFAVEDALKQNGRIKIMEGLYLNSADVFKWPSSQSAAGVGESGFCRGLRDQAAILVDGTVVPCCLDSEGTVRLGNILDCEMDEILSGARARAIYDGFSNNQPVEELCRSCGYRTRFDP